jgi:hypothetical protein
MQPRLALLCAVALLGGCSSLPGARPEPATPTASAEAVQVAQLTSYFNALHTVVRGSPADQAEVLEGARSGCEDAHQGPGCLRYALLLAAPVHAGRNPQAALRLLREVGTHPELLSPVERTLVDLETARIELELGLVTENARLVADSQAAERDRPRTAPAIAALNARLQAEINDNARLKKERDELQAKLDAIANIERNIPARPPANEGRKP